MASCRIHCHGWLTKYSDGCNGALITETHLGDVTHRHTTKASGLGVLNGSNQHFTNAGQRGEFTFSANGVATFSLINAACRKRYASVAQRFRHFTDRQSVTGKSLRVNNNLDLSFGTTIIIDLANTRNSFQALFDNIVNKVTVLMYRAWIVRYPLNREPSNGVVISARCFEGGLLSFVGVAVNSVEPIGNEEQGSIHVGVNGELECQSAPPKLCATGDTDEPLKAGKYGFLSVQDFTLDLGRCCGRPLSGDRNHRPLDIWCELNWNSLQRHYTEQDNHQHTRYYCNGSLNRVLNQCHEGGLAIFTA